MSTRREERTEAGALDLESGPWNKVGDVFFVAGHRPKVFIPHAVLDVELLRKLQRILKIEIVGTDLHPALRVSNSNG